MKLVIKSTISLIVVYLLGLTAAALWLQKEYREATQEVVTDTAEVIAKQVYATLLESVVDHFYEGEDGALDELRQIVITAVERSAIMRSLIVINKDGKPVAGNQTNVIYPDMADLFGNDLTVRISSQFKPHFSVGKHTVFIPISQEGKPLGYLELVLDNKRILNLHQQLTSLFSNIALAGLMAILILGALLHLQLSHLSTGLISIMRDPDIDRNDRRKFPRDEFSLARDTAHSLNLRVQHNVDDLGLLTKALQVGMVMLDEDYSPLFISDSARRLIGMKQGDTLYEALGDAWPVVRLALEAISTGASDQKSVNVDTVQHGAPRTLQFEFLVAAGKETTRHMLLIRDNDTVESLDENLRAATRMHTLSSIYLGAAHDLRSPISAMVMNLDLLEESMPGSTETRDDENRKRYINILKEELQRLQRFLTSFLSNATVDKHAGHESIELTTIIEELVRLFDTQANSLGISIEHTLPEQGLRVYAAGDQIRQAFMNVIVNAFEAMPGGGTLSIDVESKGDTARIKFSDNGPGIPSTLLDRIFDMHFTTKDTGTGIGLYVTRSVIHRHGGKLEINSILGEGTEVIVLLPVQPIEVE